MKQDHSKFSTVPLEALWWRAKISKEDVRWVRQHLGHGLQHSKDFQCFPKSVGVTPGPLGRDWQKRVYFVEGETAPRVQIALGDRYNYREAYGRARLAGDPHLSPHGLFRELKNGYHEHAMLFMQQFGPLTWALDSGPERGAGWINLSDFWDRHTRYVAVLQLWESRGNEDDLRQSWQWIHERLDRINRVGPASFGSVSSWSGERYYDFPGVFPWERAELPEGWEQPYPLLLQAAHEVVNYELNLHTQDCRQVWLMQPSGSIPDVTFEPTRSYASLWGALWDLFGQDVCTLKLGWRVCLECGRRFYPKDRRSVCCSSKHQALWSKRKWARENRGPQILNHSRS